MRLPRPLIIACAIVAALVGPAVGTADAVTLKDLIELKKAGLSDAVLVALIESDGTTFWLTAAEVKMLKDESFSEPLILAILKTGKEGRLAQQAETARAEALQAQREALAQVQPPAPPVVIEREIVYPTQSPVFIAPTPTVRRTSRPPQMSPVHYSTPVASPIYTPVPTMSPIYFVVPVGTPTKPATPPAPVYWGWGGKPRPDGWKENR